MTQFDQSFVGNWSRDQGPSRGELCQWDHPQWPSLPSSNTIRPSITTLSIETVGEIISWSLAKHNQRWPWLLSNPQKSPSAGGGSAINDSLLGDGHLRSHQSTPSLQAIHPARSDSMRLQVAAQNKARPHGSACVPAYAPSWPGSTSRPSSIRQCITKGQAAPSQGRSLPWFTLI